MAKRPTARAKASKATASTISSPSAALSNLKSEYLAATRFGNTKKDKRIIRHGQLLAKVREGGINKQASSSAGGKVRRPSKKLKTSVKDLGDALPDVDMGDGESLGADEIGGGEKSGVYAEDEWEGVSDEGGDDEKGDGAVEKTAGKRRRKSKIVGDGNKMVMKSLSHRQGSMKRKKVLEEKEMERFKRNLAQLASNQAVEEVKVSGGGGQEGKMNESHTQKWAALRAFIGTTMEKDKAFEGK